MKKKLLVYFSFAIVFALMIGVTYAAFSDATTVEGSSFSIGSADLKFIVDRSMGIEDSNVADNLPGPSFDNIGQNWEGDHVISILNNGTSTLSLNSTSDYETANDPDDLRQLISVEIINWADTNGDDLVDEDELGFNYGKKTIVKWKTEGFDLGEISQGQVRHFVLRFSTESISDTKQGATGVFDFNFGSLSL